MGRSEIFRNYYKNQLTYDALGAITLIYHNVYVPLSHKHGNVFHFIIESLYFF